MKFNQIVRFYGQPKLKKPKELKNIKESFAVDYIPKKCKCTVYIVNNDIWVKHRDYFSSSVELEDEDIGAPLSVLCNKYLNNDKNKKFIYDDAWGDIVLRNEAWLCVENIVNYAKENLPYKVVYEVIREQERINGFEELELMGTDMERMWDNIFNKIYRGEIDGVEK